MPQNLQEQNPSIFDRYVEFRQDLEKLEDQITEAKLEAFRNPSVKNISNYIGITFFQKAFSFITPVWLDVLMQVEDDYINSTMQQETIQANQAYVPPTTLFVNLQYEEVVANNVATYDRQPCAIKTNKAAKTLITKEEKAKEKGFIPTENVGVRRVYGCLSYLPVAVSPIKRQKCENSEFDKRYREGQIEALDKFTKWLQRTVYGFTFDNTAGDAIKGFCDGFVIKASLPGPQGLAAKAALLFGCYALREIIEEWSFRANQHRWGVQSDLPIQIIEEQCTFEPESREAITDLELCPLCAPPTIPNIEGFLETIVENGIEKLRVSFIIHANSEGLVSVNIPTPIGEPISIDVKDKQIFISETRILGPEQGFVVGPDTAVSVIAFNGVHYNLKRFTLDKELQPPVPVTFLGTKQGEFVPHIIFQFYRVPLEGEKINGSLQATSFTVHHPANTEPDFYLVSPFGKYVAGRKYAKKTMNDDNSITVRASTSEEALRILGIATKLVDPAFLIDTADPIDGTTNVKPNSRKKFPEVEVFLRFATAYLGGVNGACDGYSWRIRYNLDGKGQLR